MIRSFADKRTSAIYNDEAPRSVPPDIVPAVRRRLDRLAAVGRLTELRIPPGNRLEALKGDLAGRHSIRVNDQWRIVFRWDDDGAHEVCLTDYH
jgi:proteic killer suppression protein